MDGFDFICEADFIRASPGFHRVLRDFIFVFSLPLKHRFAAFFNDIMQRKPYILLPLGDTSFGCIRRWDSITRKNHRAGTTLRDDFLCVFNFYQIDGRFQQQIDQLVAGAIGTVCQVFQLFDRGFPHSDRDDLVTVIPLVGFLFRDANFLVHRATSFQEKYTLTRREII